MRRKEAQKLEGIELVLSASRCKTYKDCPRKYYYTYIEKLPRKEWEHFDLGELVHGVLEIFHGQYKSDKYLPTNLAHLMKFAFQTQQYTIEKNKNSLLSAEVLIDARDILRNYMLNLKQKGLNSEIVVVEEAFNIRLNDKYSIQGYIDRLDIDPDGLYHIKDYKTNKSDKYMDPFQLKTYGIYLLDKYPDIDMFRGSYIMLKLNSQQVSYDFNKEDVTDIRKDLIELADKISEEERWITKPNKLCDWCDFKNPCFNTW
ncbi:MAG: PD-(D/E)XK nuclease family protein [Patescibacteria group bacterium]|jgi:DNA helicase-2/ATP-dependent DNA helicase PcrA